MTYFTDGNQTDPTPTNDTNQNNQTTDNWLEKVVQENGEQWQDPQTLAKGYLNAQDYIKSLETQTSELREDLGKKEYAETLLKSLQSQAPSSTGQTVESEISNGATTTQENTTPTASEIDLESLIEQTLTKREKENTAKQNLELADAKLSELFGTEVKAEVDKRAEAIGMSKERLLEIASESPNAFFKLIGEEVKAEPNPTRQGTVNTASTLLNQNSGQRDWSYYQKLRRENSKLYYSPKTQTQMLKDKQALGEKFGNN